MLSTRAATSHTWQVKPWNMASLNWDIATEYKVHTGFQGVAQEENKLSW